MPIDWIVIINHIGHILEWHYREVFNVCEALGVNECLCFSRACGIHHVWQATRKKHLMNLHLGGSISSSVFSGVIIRSVSFSLFPFLSLRWSVWFYWPPQLSRLTHYAYCQWHTNPDHRTAIDVVGTLVPPSVSLITGNSLYGHKVVNGFPMSLVSFFPPDQ